MPNSLKVAIEMVLGKDTRENKLKLMSIYHWETKTKKDQNPSEFIYFADFTWVLKHPPHSLVFCPTISLTYVRLEQ